MIQQYLPVPPHASPVPVRNRLPLHPQFAGPPLVSRMVPASDGRVPNP